MSGAGVTINLSRDAGKHAFPYASGKLFFDMLRELAAPHTAPAALKADWVVVSRWLEIGEDGPNEQHRDQFARGYVAYLAEGIAPSPSLQSAFDMFRDEGLARELCPELSDSMRSVYARMSDDPALSPSQYAR